MISTTFHRTHVEFTWRKHANTNLLSFCVVGEEDTALAALLKEKIEEGGFVFSEGLRSFWSQNCDSYELGRLLTYLSRVESDYLDRKYIRKKDK